MSNNTKNNQNDIDPFDSFDTQDAKAQEIYEKARARKAAREKSRSDKRKAAKNSKNGAKNVASASAAGAVENESGPVAYVQGTMRELRASTWPTKSELFKWCIIVLATVTFFAGMSMLIDTFIATPLFYWISTLDVGSQDFGPFDIALVVVMFLSGIISMIGVYMHQGGETEGLSDTMATKLTGGSSHAQKNLDRITLIAILIFVACLIVAMLIYPTGTISS